MARGLLNLLLDGGHVVDDGDRTRVRRGIDVCTSMYRVKRAREIETRDAINLVRVTDV